MHVVDYPPLPEDRRADTLSVLALIPHGSFVLTSAFEGKRAGLIARSVAVVADEPLLVCVSLRRGHWIEPLLRDSRAFGVSLIDPSDRFAQKKFAENAPREQDPFDCVPCDVLQSQSPLLRRALAALDCEIVRRVDLEADCALIVGRVLDARLATTPANAVARDVGSK